LLMTAKVMLIVVDQVKILPFAVVILMYFL
jgi:hypothetical protein